MHYIMKKIEFLKYCDLTRSNQKRITKFQNNIVTSDSNRFMGNFSKSFVKNLHLCCKTSLRALY